MSSKKHKTPAIRFKGFTDAWEQRKLGEHVTIKSGWSPSNFVRTNSEGSELFIKVDDLNYSSREQNDSQMRVYDNPRFQKMKKGSTIFPKRGAAIMTNKVRILSSDAYMDTNMMALEPQEIDGDFLYTFIDRTGLYKIADTSTIPQINNKHIEPYIIYCPSVEEQTKVGSIFKKLDDTIALHQRKLNSYKELKKGLMQGIFSQGLRFKDEEGNDYPDWEEKKFKDVTKKISTRNKDDFPYPSCSISSKNGFVLQSEQFVNNRLENIDRKGHKIIFPNQFAYNPARINIGSLGLLRSETPVLISPLYVCFETDINLDNDYLYYFMKTDSFLKLVRRTTEGSVRDSLSYELLSLLKIPYPCLQEQIKISKAIHDFDTKIEYIQAKLDSLKELKKGLLQQMFV